LFQIFDLLISPPAPSDVNNALLLPFGLDEETRRAFATANKNKFERNSDNTAMLIPLGEYFMVIVRKIDGDARRDDDDATLVK